MAFQSFNVFSSSPTPETFFFEYSAGSCAMDKVTQSAPSFVYTEDDHSAFLMVAIVAPILLAIMTLVAKGILQRSTKAPWKAYDSLLHFSALSMVAQTICIAMATSLGLGKHSAMVEAKTRIMKVSFVRC